MKRFDPAALAARLDAHIAAESALAHFGGIGLCVAQGGNILYKKYHGCKSYATGKPLTDENGDTTLFRLASMTKPITAVAALIQVGRGLLNLDEPIENLMPEFSDMRIGKLDEDGNITDAGPATVKLTPRILLNHTNGLGTHEMGARQIACMKPEDTQDLCHAVAYISRSYLSFNPSDEQMYSPLWAFDVLARLVELTSGTDFVAFLKKNVLEPCGMKDTTFDPTPEQWSRMIAMHGLAEKDGVPCSADMPMFPGAVFESVLPCWPLGGAGLASTLPDYIRFADMLRRGGITADGVRVLPEALVRDMGTPHVPQHIMPQTERWGLGVRVIEPSHPCMPAGSFGWSGAYGSHFWVDPENDLIFVLMRNSRYDGGAGTPTLCRLEHLVYAE